VLRFPLIHPPLPAALAAAGHGGRILLAVGQTWPSASRPATSACHANLLLTIGYITPRRA